MKPPAKPAKQHKPQRNATPATQRNATQKKRPKDGKARMKTFAERQLERDKERTRYFENAPW